MASADKFFYTLVSKEFYESFDLHDPELTPYHDPVKRLLPPDWQIIRHGVWFHCHPTGAVLPEQGWKIHLSAIFSNATAILTSAARILVSRRISFKFALDRGILFLLNSKRWPRGGAGKFVTIYPRNDDEFKSVIEELYRAMVGFSGSYILSDKRYKDSQVVYYRYGGLLSTSILDITGDKQLVLHSPDGSTTTDKRNPYFVIPDWVKDPFAEESQSNSSGPDQTLKNGRYAIEEVIAFSNTGGVYVAIDQEGGQKVIIKEARPCTNLSPNGHEAVTLLKKEHRLLSLLDGTAIAPKVIDFFRDWEHYFLVQERIDGLMLRLYALRQDIALRTRPTLQDVQEFYVKYCSLYGKIAEALEVLHKHNIVFADLSFNNILVDKNGEKVTFIDFEAGHEIGVDNPTIVFTPGFASADRAQGQDAQFGDDYFAFAGLLVAGLMPINILLSLDSQACDRFLRSLTRDLGLPDAIRGAVLALTSSESSQRITPAQAMEMIRGQAILREPEIRSDEASIVNCEAALTGIVDYTLQTATYDRKDRLFPADPKVFNTNPLNIACGACGVAYSLWRITGTISPKITDWILSIPCTPQLYPPGLYIGMSGIAWALLEIGFRDEAMKIAREIHSHPLLYESPDLLHGISGWGMAQLKFFLHTGDELYLHKAIEGADYLLKSAEKDESSCWWPSLGLVHAGLGHGTSGISLFLLYLYLITKDDRFLHAGESGLEWVISKAVKNADDAYTWRLHERSDTVTPYWRYGSVGVGAAILRYYLVTRNPKLWEVVERIILDADRKYAIFPSQFFGLAGLGEFFIDMAHFNPDNPAHIASAWKAAAGALLFKLERPEGIAFPGEQLMRISCDYGTGSAGIGLFLHRLVHGGPAPFMLDELLSGEAFSETSFKEEPAMANAL
jgi:serine/threonine protein kinase